MPNHSVLSPLIPKPHVVNMSRIDGAPSKAKVMVYLISYHFCVLIVLIVHIKMCYFKASHRE